MVVYFLSTICSSSCTGCNRSRFTRMSFNVSNNFICTFSNCFFPVCGSLFKFVCSLLSRLFKIFKTIRCYFLCSISCKSRSGRSLSFIFCSINFSYSNWKIFISICKFFNIDRELSLFPSIRYIFRKNIRTAFRTFIIKMMNRINSIFRRNLPAKIVALGVAVVLWVVVMSDQNPAIEGSFTVPVAVVNSPEGYKVTKSEDTVKIKVRGARSLFVSATADDFRAYVDLSGAEAGKQSYKVQTALPQGFELVEVQPETVEFNLDKIIQKQVRADVIVTGNSAPGTTVAKVTQASSIVTIEGPQSAVESVTRVVGYVGLSGNSTDFDLQVPLTALNADGREVHDVKVVPSVTEVTVQLARGLTKKIVTIHPVLDGSLPDDLMLSEVRTDPIKLEIAGESKVLAPLSSVDTEKIDLSKVTGSEKLTVRLDLPNGVTVTNPEISVNIVVKKKEK